MTSPREIVRSASEALQGRDFVRARELFERALASIDVTTAEIKLRIDALMGLALALAEGQVKASPQLEAAAEIQQQAVALVDASTVDDECAAEVLFRYAVTLLNLGKPKAAVPVALRVVELARKPTPMARLHLSILATALFENGEAEAAVPFAEAAVALGRELEGGPDLVDLLVLVEIYGERIEALPVIAEILGLLRAEKDHDENAIRHFERLLAKASSTQAH